MDSPVSPPAFSLSGSAVSSYHHRLRLSCSLGRYISTSSTVAHICGLSHQVIIKRSTDVLPEHLLAFRGQTEVRLHEPTILFPARHPRIGAVQDQDCYLTTTVPTLFHLASSVGHEPTREIAMGLSSLPVDCTNGSACHKATPGLQAPLLGLCSASLRA